MAGNGVITSTGEAQTACKSMNKPLHIDAIRVCSLPTVPDN